MIGQTLSHYHITEKLGAGGMGEVYLAEDKKLRRKVAVKVLGSSLVTNPDRLRRFTQEAEAAAALSHPNVAHIYEVNQADGINYLVMEYVKGETLRHRMGRELALLEALDISTQVAAALSAAHQAGIIHRDIKPENIMLREDGYVKVLDFGLAKVTGRPTFSTDGESPTLANQNTEPGVVMGTVQYMSPEQARGQVVDARSDIFSLGVVIYEMAAGRTPFAADTPSDVLAFILYKEPLPLVRYSPDVPAELERIVSKALAKDRDQRYAKVQDLLIDLKRLKQRLEAGVELERMSSEAGSGAVTLTDSRAAATTDRTAPTLSRTEYLVTGIKRQKAGVVVLLIATAVASYFYFARSGSAAIDSIAVMPLVNAGNDPKTDYLSDGISESLINSLTELQQLRVVARTTAFRYKGREIDPQAVGRELNVRAVLTGRMRHVADRLNIQVDLVDTTTGAQLWGEEYERAVADVLSIKQAIARKVTEKLRLILSSDQQRQLAKRETSNSEAYQFYLRGRYLWNKRTADEIRKAIDQFQQAIDRDPNYALGYVGLADCYLVLEQYGGVPANETLPKAKAAVDRALQIDDSLAEVHTSLAEIYQRQWQWAEAEQEFRRAISLNPNYPTAHAWFTMYLRIKRQFDDALRESKRAQELDPLSPILNVASIYLLKNDINSAIEQNKRSIEFDPSFAQAHRWLGLAYIKQRRYEEAIAELQKGVELSARAGQFLGDLGYCYALMGKQTEGFQILRELEQRYVKGEAIGMYLAQVYAGFGDKDKAFEWLEKDFQVRSGVLPYITWWLSFDGLRSDPRYADLLRRMGLEP